jgi:hypothetical protein
MALKLAIKELYGALPLALERFAGPRVGGAEHPTMRAVAMRRNTLRTVVFATPLCRIFNLNIEIMIANLLDEYPMLMFVFEAGLALALLLFIVLWTGKGKK